MAETQNGANLKGDYGEIYNRVINAEPPEGFGEFPELTSFNILIGGGGSLVALVGLEGSIFIVINPGVGDAKAAVGAFVSGGKGVGGNVSEPSTNVNVAGPPGSVSIFLDPDTLEPIGITLGLGPAIGGRAVSIIEGDTGKRPVGC